MKYLLKSVIATAMLVLCSQTASAQGWPENYGGVMLQGFYWDSFAQSKWTKLERQLRILPLRSILSGCHKVATAEVLLWAMTTCTGFQEATIIPVLSALRWSCET